MYKILGADGKEYGPVNGDILRQWITQGRANAQTKVRLEGSLDWQALGSLPEFASTFSAPPGAAAAAPMTAPPVESKTSGLAISSLILGILGMLRCGATALVGLILGIVALTKINKSQRRHSG